MISQTLSTGCGLCAWRVSLLGRATSASRPAWTGRERSSKRSPTQPLARRGSAPVPVRTRRGAGDTGEQEIHRSHNPQLNPKHSLNSDPNPNTVRVRRPMS